MFGIFGARDDFAISGEGDFGVQPRPRRIAVDIHTGADIDQVGQRIAGQAVEHLAEGF